MKQDWHPDELAQHWTISTEERELLGNKIGATRLGFAVLLKSMHEKGISEVALARSLRDIFRSLMRRPHWTVLAIATIACLGTACASKTAATKSNFKTAIQAELDKEPVCISASVPKDVENFNGRPSPDAQLEPLVKVDLVTRSKALVQQSVMDLMPGEKRKQVPGLHYERSTLGKKYVKPSTHQMMSFGGPSANVCYGTRTVDEVVRYTEPASAMGMTVTQVTYTWKLTDVADWAKNPDVEKTYFTTQNLTAADTLQQATMALALSNDGWHAPG